LVLPWLLFDSCCLECKNHHVLNALEKRIDGECGKSGHMMVGMGHYCGDRVVVMGYDCDHRVVDMWHDYGNMVVDMGHDCGILDGQKKNWWGGC
jgi:hypothetical protein